MINNLPDGEVEITVTSSNIITIRTEKIKNEYQTMDPTLFPLVKRWEKDNEMTLKAEQLLSSIRRVCYAIPPLSTNAVMTSMCLQADDGQLNFVGLDGHVLAWDKVNYEGKFELLIPKNTLDKLKSIGFFGDVQILHNKSNAVFITEEFEVYTRLIEGTYYPYQTMFKELDLHTSVSRTDLLNALIRAKMCTEERCPVVFLFKDNYLNLSIKDSKTDYKETVDLQKKVDRELTIGFDAKLVIESLKSFEGDNVDLSFESAKRPMIIEDPDSDFRTLVLPVNMG